MADDPKPKCFIIMPITTPPDKYPDGENHFKHVLEGLFTPSVPTR